MIALLFGSLAAHGAPRVELVGALRGSAHLGAVGSAVSLGGAAGPRVEHGALGADGTIGWGVGIAPTVDTTVGADLSAPWKVWRPALGVEVGALWGRHLRFVDSFDDRGAYRALAFVGVRVRVHPVVLRHDRYTVTALGVAYGGGIGGAAQSFRFDVLRIGVQL